MPLRMGGKCVITEKKYSSGQIREGSTRQAYSRKDSCFIGTKGGPWKVKSKELNAGR